MVNDLYILQLNYKNEIKLKQKRYKINIDNIKKNFKELEALNNSVCEKKLVDEKNNYIKKLDTLEYDKRIDEINS